MTELPLRLQDYRALVERLLNPTLTVGETALVLDVSHRTVRRYADKNVLPCLRTPGNQRRFFLEDLLPFLDEERMDHAQTTDDSDDAEHQA